MSAGTTLSTAIENDEAASGGVCLVISSEILVFCSSDSASARDAADCGVCAIAGEIANCRRVVRTRNIRIESLTVLTAVAPTAPTSGNPRLFHPPSASAPRRIFMLSVGTTGACSHFAAQDVHGKLMIHVLHFHACLIQYRSHECRNDRGSGPQLAAAHPPAPGEARLSARQDLAPPARDRRDRGQERRACAADERGDPGGLRVAHPRDRRRRR